MNEEENCFEAQVLTAVPTVTGQFLRVWMPLGEATTESIAKDDAARHERRSGYTDRVRVVKLTIVRR